LAGDWSEQSARESWRFPPLPVRQVDNWGDARVVELALEDENFGEPRFGEPRRASDSLACDSMGGVGAGGFVGELKTGGRGAEASPPGRLVAKLAGDVPGKLVPGKLQCGEPLALELAVNKSHWFDSATHRRLEWLP
jgi:hypothetical protein